ncbi:hypothetical protein [Streptosporangium minutum]|uniref:hypothetical protein n=1 Tax=Streptosporangium minutum TaxID=569862 RepID=UPI001055BFA1|nr:hypothetical protein [Streptosporangium minutum]
MKESTRQKRAETVKAEVEAAIAWRVAEAVNNPPGCAIFALSQIGAVRLSGTPVVALAGAENDQATV